uniref:Uncharacterized protein n=1 Tax=Romanomermis culicivorax TaxID=13658 RepID=A0A915JN41_ROMCU
MNRTQSPDNDSAFCDSNSLASSESIFSTHNNNGIEATVKKPRRYPDRIVNVKFFFGLDSSSSKDLIVDERWSVGYVLKILAVEFRIPFSINHVLLEMCLDMHLERIYEDHELLLENVSLWTADSTNEIHFVEKASKYDLFYNPQ